MWNINYLSEATFPYIKCQTEQLELYANVFVKAALFGTKKIRLNQMRNLAEWYQICHLKFKFIPVSGTNIYGT